MNLPKISVIIPVYNTERHLKRCINSVLNQTYKNIELVIVDDCTKDNSENIINSYVKEGYNIKYVKHDVNRGLFQARITGIENASGDYFAFLDSDDYVSHDFYRKLLYTLQEKNADICIADYVYEFENGNQTYANLDPIRNSDIVLENEQILDTVMSYEGKCFSWTVVWNKLYKKEVVLNSLSTLKEFSEKTGRLIMLEDIAFSLTYFLNAHKIVNCHNVYLYYFQHKMASTKNSNFSIFERNANNCKQVFEYVENLFKNTQLLNKYSQNLKNWKDLIGRRYYIDSKNVNSNKAVALVKDIFNGIEQEPINDDFYFLHTMPMTEYNNYENIIDAILDKKTKIVSFDIFDTLVLRNAMFPTDVFYFMNKYFEEITDSKQYLPFSQMRIDAEKGARLLTKNEDITIDEIYSHIENKYNIPSNLCKKLIKKEKEMEVDLSLQRKTGKDLFEIAKLNNKQICLTSDMYLDRTTIFAILQKNGYCKEDFTFYLSCEKNKTKATGNLYDLVISEQKVKPNEIVHIGDNYNSDYKRAKTRKINAYHLPNAWSKMSEDLLCKTYINNLNEIDTSCMLYENVNVRRMFSVVTNKLFDFPFQENQKNTDFCANPTFIGYYALGMHLYSVVKWLIDNNKNNTIHFVARDGYLPKLAFDEITNQKCIKSNYLYLSRKALLTLDVYKQIDLLSVVRKSNILNLSVKKLAEYFNSEVVNYNVLKENCKKANIRFDKKFTSNDEFFKAVGVFDNNALDYKKHNKSKDVFKKYFEAQIKQGDVLFDVGYSGRAESCLTQLLGFPVNSFYIHINGDSASEREKASNFKIQTFYSHKRVVTGFMREQLFMAQHNSLSRYEVKDGKVELVFSDKKGRFVEDKITQIVQKQALQFVKDLTLALNGDDLNIDNIKDVCSVPYEYYLHHGSLEDLKVFDCIDFEDDIGVGTIKAVDAWQESQRIVGSTNTKIASENQTAAKFVRKINKLLPYGSKRRNFVKKVAKFFIR